MWTGLAARIPTWLGYPVRRHLFCIAKRLTFSALQSVHVTKLVPTSALGKTFPNKTPPRMAKCNILRTWGISQHFYSVDLHLKIRSDVVDLCSCGQLTMTMLYVVGVCVCVAARVVQAAAGRQCYRRLWGLFPEADCFQFLWHDRHAACCGQQQKQNVIWWVRLVGKGHCSYFSPCRNLLLPINLMCSVSCLGLIT